MNSQKQFLGARVESHVIEIVDKVATEQHTDRTHALKLLISEGWKKLQLEKSLELYRKGKISLDHAAGISGLTVSEMMEAAASAGIKSEETLDDYTKGIKILLAVHKTKNRR